MSYCRWSSDNFRSDVYVYESLDGYVTHIASNRLVGPRLPDPPLRLGSYGKIGRLLWRVWYRVKHFTFKFLIRVNINHPEAGETYVSDTALDCVDVLKALRSAGFVVPQHAIDQLIMEDQEDES